MKKPIDVKHDSFDTMWSFLQMGCQKSDIPGLKEHCKTLREMMMQKTAGQRKDKPNDVDFADLDMLCNFIVIEAMCLYLSGDLDRLEGGPA
nr:MAG TPA: hypothetical protein [Caudoviricetes sp.]